MSDVYLEPLLDRLRAEVDPHVHRGADVPPHVMLHYHALLALCAQASKIASLTTELYWWKTKSIRSEPMDPKAPPANLPDIIRPVPPRGWLVTSGARLLKFRPGGEVRRKP